MQSVRFMLAAGLTAAVAMPALAQGGMSSESKSDAMADKGAGKAVTAETPSAQAFVTRAGMANLFAIKAGETAEDKTMNRKVDRYVRTIVNDHKQLHVILELMAESGDADDVEVPSKLDPAHRKRLARLQAATGAEFLAAFKAQQVKGHEQSVALVARYAENGGDDSLKGWAESSLPVLRKHLRQAQDLPTAERTPTAGVSDAAK